MYLYEVHQKGCHRAVCEEYADWCLNGAILTSNGGMAHVWGPGVDGVELGTAEFRHQLWIDTTMMACVFMYQYGTASKNAALVRQAEKQMEIHLDSLFDKQAGLCYHAYDCRTQRKLGCFWGRGNGWIVTAMAEFFRLGCKNPALVGAFQTIMEHAYACRMENGFLHTLINDKDSYMESTGSMLFGYAAAVGCKMGVLPAVSGDWALQIAAGLEFHQNGCVKYASGGTDPSAAEVYKNIPYVETVYSFGIVMALAAGLLENGMK